MLSRHYGFVWSEAQVERRSSVTASLRGYSPSMRIISRRCGSLLNQIPSDPREAGPWLRQSKDAGLAGLDVDHSWILKGATPIRPLCLRSVVSTLALTLLTWAGVALSLEEARVFCSRCERGFGCNRCAGPYLDRSLMRDVYTYAVREPLPRSTAVRSRMSFIRHCGC